MCVYEVCGHMCMCSCVYGVYDMVCSRECAGGGGQK